MVTAGQGLFSLGNDMPSIVVNIIWMVAFFAIIILFNQRMQIWSYQRNVEKATARLQFLADKSREDALNSIKQFAQENVDIRSQVTGFLDFFLIEPVDRDPFGVLGRLEHILDNRRDRFKAFVSQIAPKAGKTDAANTEDILEAAMALNLIFKVVRHYLLLGKKTKSLMIFVQLDMQLPMIMKMAEAYFSAQKTFSAGKPIGDGLGALVASKLMLGQPKKQIAEEVVYAELDLSNRKVVVLKAEGPGGVVGKPGEAVKQLVENLGGKVARIFMIDAAAKLEGEKTGEVVEGIGAAIGDPGPEKFKIEDVATKYKIPVDAIICKMDLEEALTTIRKEVVEASDVIVERIKKAILERTKEGDVVIVAGIGNTIGVGQ
ncbi:MAG: DUF1512 domain-containing protein [Candidatus Verstraetearchaeota archaeon]|nr:DUF1512 domain-containing protein [Candidatus Verstraetearchaeota archaeon]